MGRLADLYTHITLPEQKKLEAIAMKMSNAGMGSFEDAYMTVAGIVNSHKAETAMFYAMWNNAGYMLKDLITRLESYSKRETF